MKPSRVDVGSIRREQIIQAAIAVIDEQGIQNLSLSAIENKTGMRRGQLTYYFRTKESILLAVFDRLLRLMIQAVEGAEGCQDWSAMSGWARFRHLLTLIMLRPPLMPQFHSLQYTFLSQTAHREDFRQALANLYENWRAQMAEDFAADLARKLGPRAVSPRTFATMVQALLHGLGMQRAADPNAYDRQEMLDLCLDVLGSYLNHPPPSPGTSDIPVGPSHTRPAGKPDVRAVKSSEAAAEEPTNSANGQDRRRLPRRPARPKRVNHDQRE
jgi:AcrR family transcriptional regulator